MKEELKNPLMIAVVVVLVAVVAFYGFKSIGNAGNLDQGQVKYTPGKPPWEETDPSKRGPGGSPGGGAQTAPPQPGMPVGPPVLGNGN